MIAEVRIHLSRVTRHYQISYLKVPSVLALIGGLFSGTLNLFQLIYFPFWDNDFYAYMQQKLFKLEVETEDDIVSSIPLKVIEQEKISEEEKNQRLHVESLVKRVRKLESKREENNSDNSNQKILENQEIRLVKRNKFLKGDADVILNKDIHKLLEPPKKLREEIFINKSERFFFTNCCCSRQRKTKNDPTKIKYEMLQAATAELGKKVEILEILKLFDQFKLLQQICLNENQCFMIKNRNLLNIVNNRNELNHKVIQEINEAK